MTTDGEGRTTQRITDVLQQYWGFDTMRPLQEEAIRAGLEHRDSLVVMPTGGGKSLCYQVPPVVTDRTDIVVSPLISLMKDQVDGLRACGYPAAALNSSMSDGEQRKVFEALRDGTLRLLFVSPERLLQGSLLSSFQEQVRAIAIDEAHCISHWGHDFRPAYKNLGALKDRVRHVSIHAFTATATPRVQRDIVEQLGLEDPHVMVGSADRPNLTYRVVPRLDANAQIVDVVRRHPREAVIIYCITRKETESIASVLRANGIRAAAYHAGMRVEDRRRTQEEFSAESLDVVVATVAFGMGIDRSNVRCVIHAAMPKSIEHYQQETGRAGRDGLEAECVLLYSAADVLRWKGLVERSAGEAADEIMSMGSHPDESDDPMATLRGHLEAQMDLLRHMQGLCSTLQCRHRALSRYFGQTYPSDDCQACDVCLGEVDAMPDSTMIARKILSCVARMEQRFGVGQVVQVLRGAGSEAVRKWGHERLSTYGLLRELPEKTVTNLVYQLVDQELLVRSGNDRPTLQLNDDSVAVMRGERDVWLIEPKSGAVASSKASTESWEGVDRGLFEALREVRRILALERGVAAYQIFSDATLREMARIRPGSSGTMRAVKGVGERKLVELGPTFLEAIESYCTANDLELDVDVVALPAAVSKKGTRPSRQRAEAMRRFERGESIEEVAEATNRKIKTVSDYLADFVRERQPERIDEWVPEAIYDRVAAVAASMPTDRLKPMYQRLDGEVPYEMIRIVIAHQEALGAVGARAAGASGESE